MIAARPTALSARAASSMDRQDPLAIKMVGLTFVVLISALFWMGFAAAVGYLASVVISMKALAVLGSAVALFLTAVCAPLMLRT